MSRKRRELVSVVGFSLSLEISLDASLLRASFTWKLAFQFSVPTEVSQVEKLLMAPSSQHRHQVCVGRLA